MFLMLLILPESSSVVISRGLVAVVMAVITQDIVWDLRDEATRVRLQFEMTCSFRSKFSNSDRDALCGVT